GGRVGRKRKVDGVNGTVAVAETANGAVSVTGTAPPGLVVRTVPVDALHCDPANARTHDERNLRTIRDSLKEFGQVEPLVVRAGTGKVIGGNGRLEAMRALGWSRCHVVAVDADEVTCARLALVLNRSGELATWDYEALATVLKGIDGEGAPITDLGWEPFELEPLLKGQWAAPEEAPNGDVVTDPEAEWDGMPEFKHEDQTSQFRAIVHFANETDVRAFEELVGQKIPANTRAIWYPKAERQVVKGSGYVSD